MQEWHRVVNVSLTSLFRITFRHKRDIWLSGLTYPFFEIGDLDRNKLGLRVPLVLIEPRLFFHHLTEQICQQFFVIAGLDKVLSEPLFL